MIHKFDLRCLSFYQNNLQTTVCFTEAHTPILNNNSIPKISEEVELHVSTDWSPSKGYSISKNKGNPLAVRASYFLGDMILPRDIINGITLTTETWHGLGLTMENDTVKKEIKTHKLAQS